jgi:hypothetical protein
LELSAPAVPCVALAVNCCGFGHPGSKNFQRIPLNDSSGNPFWTVWTLHARCLSRGQGYTTPPSLRLETKEADPFVALSKQDCDVSLGGKQGVVGGSRWIFPGARRVLRK